MRLPAGLGVAFLMAGLAVPASAQFPPCDDPPGVDTHEPFLRDPFVGVNAVPFGTKLAIVVQEPPNCVGSPIVEAHAVIDGAAPVSLDVEDDPSTPEQERYGHPFRKLRVSTVLPPAALGPGTHTVAYEARDEAGNVGRYAGPPPDHPGHQRIYVYSPLVSGDCHNAPALVCP